MAVVEETIKPEDIRRQISEREDQNFALRLQNDEYSNLTESNVTRSKERSENLISGHNVATSFSNHEKVFFHSINKMKHQS